MKNSGDAERIRAAFKATRGIVKYEFEQYVIERVASGESGFEEKEAVLMVKW
ncbi:hypothetical protein [Acinetobacter sp. ACNIH2]|uniref:hypothetical protein n=1 Tax=Acinetobacter sp. ACNIH2 TaxID=1758189 RepID=UPI000A671B7E|nr:hypothetical protein [Acinetobacter sp. ACNIH2]